MENISGNYNTHNEEIEAVKEYLNKENIKFSKIQKYSEANAGDIIVTFPNNTYSLFEVKQESEERFLNKYGEYGIDFISSLVFKNPEDKNKWKGIHNPNEFNNFINSLDIENPNFKWGKIYYSYSDVWLFYVQNKQTKKYEHLKAYNGKKLDNINFFLYLKNNCQFAINLKSEEQLSHNDIFDSATFFIKPEILKIFESTKNDIIHNSNFIETLNINNQTQQNKNIKLIGNNTMNIYHFPNCQYVPTTKTKIVEFNSIIEAELNGYKPCATCNPNKNI